jgi:membrane-anchored mycosin MYCP
MAQAIQYAVDNDADVINISQSSCQPIASAVTQPGNAELQTAVYNAYRKGVVVVAAAGNVSEQCQKNPSGNPTTAVLPAWFDDYVLTVASVNQQGAPADHTVPGPWVDVAAPGENLISLDPGQNGSGLASQIATDSSGKMSPIMGTSFAAPYVSGLAALIKQKAELGGKTLTAEQVMERIKSTALHPGGNSGGRNDLVGFGMIDPMAALSDTLPANNTKPGAMGPRRLGAHVIPQTDYPAIFTALGVSCGGIGAVIFTAFLVKAVRRVRARRSGAGE